MSRIFIWTGKLRLGSGMRYLMILLFAMLYYGNASFAVAAAPEDFSCRGIVLGDTEAKLLQTFGPPLFDRDIMIHGVRVKQYTFAHEFTAAVSQRTRKVVDITMSNHDFITRDAICYGATPYKIEQVYGRIPRVQLAGKTYYIYRNPSFAQQRLLIEVESVQGYLLSMHWTSLPITDEEEDTFMEEAPVSPPVKLHLEISQ